MCDELRMPDGRIIATQVELAAMVGGANYVLYDSKRDRPHAILSDTGCLCPVDLDRTAAAQGWELDYDSDPFYVQVIA